MQAAEDMLHKMKEYSTQIKQIVEGIKQNQTLQAQKKHHHKPSTTKRAKLLSQKDDKARAESERLYEMSSSETDRTELGNRIDHLVDEEEGAIKKIQLL